MGRGGFGEAHDAVEAIVVGNRDGREPLAGRFGDQRFGRRHTVEEAEAGVHVQLGVVDERRLGNRLLLGRLIGRPVVRPRRGITRAGTHRRG